MTWTVERVEELKTRWVTKEYSSSAIAVMMGTTRNAVLGKIHRLGLSEPNFDVQERKRKLREERIAQGWIPFGKKRQRLRQVPRQWRRKLWEQSKSDDPPQKQPENGITLMDLRLHHCRWPLGDGPAKFFCGDTAVEKLSYCPQHCLMAYQSA